MIAPVIIALFLWAIPARAQSVVPTNDDTLMLSRVAVSESGWDSPRDHAAILLVLRNVAYRYSRRYGRHVTIAEAARIYSPRATGVRRERGRQRWVQTLDFDLEQPDEWPAEYNWIAYKQKWKDVIGRSRRLLMGLENKDEKHACAMQPHHWGGPIDDARAERLRMVRIDCGETRNRFYVRQ